LKTYLSFLLKTAALVVGGFFFSNTFAQAKWEPTKNVEFIVPAGTGGGADQMARFLQGVITKHKLMAQPLVVVNKSGGAGAEGFLDAKGSQNHHHAVQFIHHTFGNGRALQLEGLDTCGHAGIGRVCALGQCRVTL
jgi:tripartite-type tricarboxylate transporter receptor subunit TctC